MVRWKKPTRWLGRGLILAVAVTLIGAGFGWRWERSEYNAFLEAHYDPPGQIINVGGQDFHVVVQGTGSPGVLLLSGLGDDSRDWSEIQGRLADSTLVVSYDRPGLGWSPPRADGLTMDAAVEDVRGILSSPGLFEAAPILMGHSLGGLIAWQVAQKYPSLVSGLILVDSPPPQGLPLAFGVVNGIIVRLAAWSGAVGLHRRSFYRANPQLTRDQQLQLGHLNASGSRARGRLRELDMLGGPVALPQEGFDALPLTLLIAPVIAPPGFGGSAVEFDTAKRRMLEASERGRLVEVETGHYIHLENPDTVISVVLDMLYPVQPEVAEDVRPNG
jgi:pimeloyl-ACP methyl ester carboxylesterase